MPLKDQKEILAESIVEAINIANELRRSQTRWFRRPELLDDLPVGIPSMPSHCVLAKAFNFGCSVSPSLGGTRWYVYFPKSREAHARKLATLLVEDGWPVLCGNQWRVPLPQHIADIAIAFDSGSLDHKYYLGAHSA